MEITKEKVLEFFDEQIAEWEELVKEDDKSLTHEFRFRLHERRVVELAQTLMLKSLFKGYFK